MEGWRSHALTGTPIDLSSPTYMISVHVIDELSEIDGYLDRTLAFTRTTYRFKWPHADGRITGDSMRGMAQMVHGRCSDRMLSLVQNLFEGSEPDGIDTCD
jgi:hypothetical protein